MSSKITLVLGGVRSGKSAFAEKLVRELNLPVLYLATGQVTDDEMARRIRLHQEARPPSWITLEEPLEISEALGRELATGKASLAIMVDSLDTWMSNILLAHEDKSADELELLVKSQVESLIKVCENWSATAVMVSSEVGHSLVPPNELGRRFQDLLGLMNQQVAKTAQQVFMVVAGIPVAIKDR